MKISPLSRILLSICLILVVCQPMSALSEVSRIADKINDTQLKEVQENTKRLIRINTQEAFDAITNKLSNEKIRVEVKRKILLAIADSMSVLELADIVLERHLSSDDKEEVTLAKTALLLMEHEAIADMLISNVCNNLITDKYRSKSLNLFQSLNSPTSQADIDRFIKLSDLLNSRGNKELKKQIIAALKKFTKTNEDRSPEQWKQELHKRRGKYDRVTLLKTKIDELEKENAQQTSDFNELKKEYISIKLENLALKNDTNLYVAELKADNFIEIIDATLAYLGKQAKLTEPHIEKLKDVLLVTNTNTQKQVIQLLGKFKVKSSVPDLKILLEHENPSVKMASIRALADIGSASLVVWADIYRILSNEKNPIEQRSAALNALIRFAKKWKATEHPVIVEAILSTYLNPQDTSHRLRIDIVHDIIGIEDSKALKATHTILHVAMKDSFAPIRLEAIQHILKGKYLGYKEDLLGALADDIPNHRKEVRKALQAIYGFALLANKGLYQSIGALKDKAIQTESNQWVAGMFKAISTREPYTKQTLAGQVKMLATSLALIHSDLKANGPALAKMIFNGKGIKAENYKILLKHVKTLDKEQATILVDLYNKHLSLLYGKVGNYRAQIDIYDVLIGEKPKDKDLADLFKKRAFAEFTYGDYASAQVHLAALPEKLKIDHTKELWWTIKYDIAVSLFCQGKHGESNALLDTIKKIGIPLPANKPLRFKKLRYENERATGAINLGPIIEKLKTYNNADPLAKLMLAKDAKATPENFKLLVDMLRSSTTKEQFDACVAIINTDRTPAIKILYTDTMATKLQTIISLR